ncbi:MAG: hypothetical protein ABSA47_12825 [Verrucomicrobiota bacterium]
MLICAGLGILVVAVNPKTHFFLIGGLALKSEPKQGVFAGLLKSVEEPLNLANFRASPLAQKETEQMRKPAMLSAIPNAQPEN